MPTPHARSSSADPGPARRPRAFPVGDGPRTLFQATTAKAICRRCPLQDACLKGAFERGEEFGGWGGTD
ncbi:WhiB family transcriptional regulator [Streptomyces prasinus]